MENLANYNKLKNSKYYGKFIKDERKYFSIVFFIFLLIVAIGFYSPYIEEKTRKNWAEELNIKIIKIENEVKNVFNYKNDLIVNTSKELKEKIRFELLQKETNYKNLLELVLQEKYEKFTIQVFSNTRELIAWNNKKLYSGEDLEKVPFEKGETFFKQTILNEYISLIDTIKLSNSNFYFTVNLPVEKNYQLSEKDFLSKNLTQRLSDKFETSFEIQYFPYASHTKDGRKYSFDIINNKGNKIGVITFVKPFLDTSINILKENIFAVQSLLILFGIVCLFLGFKYDYKKIKSRIIKFILLTGFLIITRYALFYTGAALIFIKGSVTEASYFASTFGEGIVKSPLEFFITNLFFIPLVVIGWKYFYDYKNSNKKLFDNRKLEFILAFVLLFLSFPLLRALASAIKSVIYDSKIRYFDEISLVPSIEIFIMLVNILLTAFTIISFIIFFLKIIEYLVKPIFRINKKYFLIFCFVYVFAGLTYFHFQNEPLLNFTWVLISLLIIILTYFYLKYKIDKIKYALIIISISASLLSINYLIYFNSQYEHSLLKTVAIDINRPNDILIELMLSETLQNISRDEEVVKIFGRNYSNADRLAFLMWTKSNFPKERLQSAVYIFNDERKIIGSFGTLNDINNIFPNELLGKFSEEIIVDNYLIQNENYKSGIIPIYQRGRIVGYIGAMVLMEKIPGFNTKIPDFLLPDRSTGIYSYLPSEIIIYKIVDKEISDFYGNVYPTRNKLLEIVNNKFNADNEVWFSIQLDNENYLAYSNIINADGKEVINTIALKERHLAWNLFNFFKVFFVHFIFILCLLILFFLSDYKQIKQLKFSFRNQLLIAFLLISIIPVLTLAAYNRKVASDKSYLFIKNELKERCDYLINHMNVQRSKNKDRNINQIFINAGKELGISFAVYENENLIYHSKEVYYSAGLFTPLLNPEVYNKLFYDGNIQIFLQEKLNGFLYDSYYKSIQFDGKTYVVAFNDIFNKLQVSFTTIDIDVFLFGVYSFAVLIIIIISSLIANKISAPIRRLTKATESIAHGDFNITIENKEKGEVHDLINGFNQMTKELERNQKEIAELERESAWKEMAKQVAHEIKNPLTPMKLAMQQLIQSFNDKSPKFDEYFTKISNTILNQIETLNSIASEFSRFARMPNFNIEKFDIIPVIQDVINLFIEEKKKINLSFEISSIFIEADISQFRRMFINLIRNSIQANASEVNIKVFVVNNLIEIEIIDNGIGVQQDKVNKIFDLNFTTKEKGMGLGLKLSKRFLESIDGKIELKSSKSGETKFIITISQKV